ncbi:MAG: hypothetical protein AAGB31_03205 [Bdellovibrio sp.]
MRLVFTLSLLVVALSACARPNYINSLADDASTSETADTNKFPKTSLLARLQWLTEINTSIPAELLVELQGNLTQFDELTAHLWMPSMGHGSAPLRIDSLSPAKFHLSRMYFIMPGDWEVRLLLKKDGQVIDQLFIPLMVP